MNQLIDKKFISDFKKYKKMINKIEILCDQIFYEMENFLNGFVFFHPEVNITINDKSEIFDA